MRQIPALAACLALAALVAVALTPPAPTFTLLAFAPDGNVYALDTGLTADDCNGALAHAMPGDALACDPE